MSIEYIWKVESLECYPTFDTHEDVVFKVHYEIQATDDAGYTADAQCSQVLIYDSSGPFVPYDQLSEEQIISWVRSAIGDDSCNKVEADLAGLIDIKRNPPVVQPPLPWSSSN
jgi:hypothetical protein